MPKEKLKTIYVCTQCGETSPLLAGALPVLRRVEYHDRGCRSRACQSVLRQGRRCAACNGADKPCAAEAEKHQHHRGKNAAS